MLHTYLKVNTFLSEGQAVEAWEPSNRARRNIYKK
jgi:hypothetical protein